MNARDTSLLDNLIGAAWSQVSHAGEQELEAKFAGNQTLSLRWTSIRERATQRANALEAQRAKALEAKAGK